ncbi:hypothetical protein E8D34_11810 [Nocardioides sp. GY 10113]|uniref:hypothetical protein n=1 Tax=Nocardioides sp. GY 10113 TaxID=2569761 RepID=UPI0010A935DC|nr:hypothetical protein [Nocardioides sp. GY 10113]TIC79667.1 hypothetical protein E8D34_20000 [Nocardioides sp. GY 10113]TIC85792.1 hypothetical protein E8D34_11810 [Nocardioides sp. GY 10113]
MAGFAVRHSRLARLWDDVEAARSSERTQAGKTPLRSDAAHAARSDTLDALLAYAEAIESLAWPVPRGIQLEIRLYRSLCGRAFRS